MAAQDDYYDFRYALFDVRAQFSETHVEVKMGIRTVVFPLSELQYVFVDDRKDRDCVELLVSCLNQKGKQYRCRIFSDHHEAGFYQLVDALLDKRPSADIRDLPVEDAYACVGTRQLEWVAIPLMMFGAILLTALMCTPLLVHGCDSGLAHLTMAQLARQQALPTRNVQFSKYTAFFDESVGDKGSEKDASLAVDRWIPLRALNALSHEPVGVIAQVRISKTDRFEELRQGKKMNGIIRDVWWEGLAGRQRRLLTEKGVQLDKKVLVIEIGVEPQDDLNLALFILLAMFIPALGVTLFLWRRARGRIKIKMRV